jgi:regulator of cell morphogenesis and NO signaling
MPLSPTATVANVVMDHSECAEVFARNRIDFCCRGGLTLEEAAASRQLAVDALISELTVAIDRRKGRPVVDLRAATAAQLCAHIIVHLHEPLSRALPLVRTLATKVGRVHGSHNPKLVPLATAVIELDDTLTPHLEVELSTIFPEITDDLHAPRVAEVLMREHEAVLELLSRIRLLSDDFTVPDWGCTSYRTLFTELQQLEAIVFARLHLENNVLLPRLSS